jgi:hypothetical protein
MSKSIISLRRGTSTLAIARRELDRIESLTGNRPEDWFMTSYDEDIDDYYGPDGFEWDDFEMHLAMVADSYIDFVHEHYADLIMDI